MTRPSSGVRPIEVSIDFPRETAEADAPLPRCRTITSASERPSSRPASRETYACEVPWKP